MDAPTASPLKASLPLLALCLVVAIAGWLWSAWDMLGPERRSMLQGWDDSYYYFWLPSVVIDHDVDFSNQLTQSETMNHDMREIVHTMPRTPIGLPDNKYPPGWALGNLPFFLLVHPFMPANATGFEPPYLLAVTIGQLLYAALGLWLAVRILSRAFSGPVATGAVLIGWLVSPLVYYQSARLTMTHSAVFTLAMAVFWLSLRLADGDRRPRLWLLLGFCSALLVATRNVAAIYLALPAWLVFRHLRSGRAALLLLAGAALPTAVQLLAWKSLYGSWLVYSYGGERFDFSQLRLREVLFSARHGWFYWHPLMLVGIAAFVPWAWRRAEGRAWLASLAIIVLLDAAWPTWWLGSSFGHRGFEVPTLFAMIGLAVLIEYSLARRLARWFAMTVASAAIAWNLAVLVLFLTHAISREAPVTYRDILRQLLP